MVTTAGKPLAGRVALVTGAGRARGIGAATANRLAGLGADVMVTDIARKRADLQIVGVGLGDSMEALEGVARNIGDNHGVRSAAVAFDVADAKEAQAVIDRTVDDFGRLDVLINNAGTAAGVSEFQDSDDEAWTLAWHVNVLGMSRLSKLALPYLAANGDGSIINVASTAGLIGMAGYGAYNVTKHAVVGLTRLLAAELGPRGIRVNAVAPGFIHTDMGAAELAQIADESGSSLEDTTNGVLAQIPLRRLGTGDDVAEVVAWLASGAPYVNGAIIPIDGGSGR